MQNSFHRLSNGSSSSRNTPLSLSLSGLSRCVVRAGPEGAGERDAGLGSMLFSRWRGCYRRRFHSQHCKKKRILVRTPGLQTLSQNRCVITFYAGHLASSPISIDEATAPYPAPLTRRPLVIDPPQPKNPRPPPGIEHHTTTTA